MTKRKNLENSKFFSREKLEALISQYVDGVYRCKQPIANREVDLMPAFSPLHSSEEVLQFVSWVIESTLAEYNPPQEFNPNKPLRPLILPENQLRNQKGNGTHIGTLPLTPEEKIALRLKIGKDLTFSGNGITEIEKHCKQHYGFSKSKFYSLAKRARLKIVRNLVDADQRYQMIRLFQLRDEPVAQKLEVVVSADDNGCFKSMEVLVSDINPELGSLSLTSETRSSRNEIQSSVTEDSIGDEEILSGRRLVPSSPDNEAFIVFRRRATAVDRNLRPVESILIPHIAKSLTICLKLAHLPQGARLPRVFGVQFLDQQLTVENIHQSMSYKEVFREADSYTWQKEDGNANEISALVIIDGLVADADVPQAILTQLQTSRLALKSRAVFRMDQPGIQRSA